MACSSVECTAAAEGRAEDHLGPLTHYILVRKDMPVGARDAQLAHAVGDSLEERHPPGTYVVVLACRDEAHLTAEAARLESKGVALVRVVEDSGPFAGQLTAVGLRPARRETVRRFMSSLPALRP